MTTEESSGRATCSVCTNRGVFTTLTWRERAGASNFLIASRLGAGVGAPGLLWQLRRALLATHRALCHCVNRITGLQGQLGSVAVCHPSSHCIGPSACVPSLLYLPKSPFLWGSCLSWDICCPTSRSCQCLMSQGMEDSEVHLRVLLINPSVFPHNLDPTRAYR